jgi:hypothetical protein
VRDAQAGGAFGAGTTGDSIDPMFLALFIGIVIGGVGVLVALSGGARLWKHFHQQDIAAVTPACSSRAKRDITVRTRCAAALP